jgi:hypothetical protein
MFRSLVNLSEHLEAFSPTSQAGVMPWPGEELPPEASRRIDRDFRRFLDSATARAGGF